MSEIINGHYLRVFVDNVAVAKSTECSYSLQTEMREVSHKDTDGTNGGFKEVRPGQKSGTMTTSALYAEGESYESLFSAWENGTELDLLFSDDKIGHAVLSVKGYVSSLEKNAPNNENVTYSANFEMSGAISRVHNS